MRIDHHAYRKATGVAGFGLLLQAGMALALLIFGQSSLDTVFQFVSLYFFGGLIVWGCLVAVFYQHRQERLEALEADELAASRGGSVFDAAREGEKPAARRVRLMHRWLLPIASLVLATYLACLGWLQWRYMGLLDDPSDRATEFFTTAHRGWAVAVCLSFALISFIFSRFVAGMSRQAAWRNLRGGAAFMVGNVLVLLATTVGLIFRFFDNEAVIEGVAWAIPFFLWIMAVEIVLNFVLQLYRPRVPGEVPRPAFDSRLLSLIAAPESIVQTLGDAINYQFGFDLTSSWGYKLLIRSAGWLAAFAIIVLVLLNMMVVVEPHQQAIKLARGRLVGEPGDQVHGAGMLWKLPWPLQTAEVYDVSRIRTMALTPVRREDPAVELWSQEVETLETREPFLVGGSRLGPDLDATVPADIVPLSAPDVSVVDADAARVRELFALVDAEIILRYRIKADGLLDHLSFSSDTPRRSRLDMRELVLKDLALREVTQQLSRLTVDEAIGSRRADLLASLRQRLQGAFDRHRTGIEVVTVDLPMLRPAGATGRLFEDLNMAYQNRRAAIDKAQSEVRLGAATFVGDVHLADVIAEEIRKYNQMRDHAGPDDPGLLEQRLLIEQMLTDARGHYGLALQAAEANRWVELMKAQAQVYRFEGQLDAYRTAPEIFRERQSMLAIQQGLDGRRKYFLVGLDPSQIELDVELKEVDSVFFAGQQETAE